MDNLLSHLRRLAAPLFIAGAALIVYWPGLSGGFIFDDFSNLVADPDWKVSSLELAEWRRAMALGIASDLGRPLALLSFAINHYFTGMETLPLKATGLLLHVLNGILAFTLCRRLFAIDCATSSHQRLGTYAALMVALAWTLHPLQVSTVLYTVQRMEVGAHTGVLLAILCYLKARHLQLSGSKSRAFYLATLAFTLFGLGFKETALLVPGYALVIELCILRFRAADGSPSKPLIIAYSILLSSAGLAFLVGVVPSVSADVAYSYRDFSLPERLLTQLHAIWMYVGQSLLPLPNNLLFYYDNFPVSTSLFSPSATARGFLLITLLLCGAYFSRIRWPLASLGILWFFVAHSLTSNVLPLELAFEHRNYFSLLGILIAGAQVLSSLGSRLHMDARRVIAALPVLLFAALCSMHTHTWGDPFQLASALATRNPTSVRATYDFAKQLLEKSGGDTDSPMFALAVKEFEHASRIPSSNALPEQALIIVLSRSGEVVPTQLWDRLREKLKMRNASPQEINSIRSIADCRRSRLCMIDDNELLATFFVALEVNPNSAALHSLYAGYAFSVLGDRDLGVEMMRRAVELAPENLQYRVNLARLIAAANGQSTELLTLTQAIRVADVYGIYRDETARGFIPMPPPDVSTTPEGGLNNLH